MQTKVGPVALRCLKIAAAVSRVADRRKMERVTSAAGRTTIHIHSVGRQGAATTVPTHGATVVIGQARAQIPRAGGTRFHLHLGSRREAYGATVVIGEDSAQISR
jgi:hypothetical protein